MKKSCLFILIFLLMFLHVENKSSASVDELPLGKNYLDLNNLVEVSKEMGEYTTIEPFKVKPNTRYTLVVSKEMLYGIYDTMDGEEGEISEGVDGGQNMSIFFSKDVVNERMYVEFESFDGDYLYFEKVFFIPTPGLTSYDIIMYEGDYESFDGYEPYITVSQSATSGKMMIDYDDRPTVETVSGYVSASTTDGSHLTTSIYSDAYTGSTQLPGSYDIIFEASHNNITRHYLLTMIVEDLTAPVLSHVGDIEVDLSEKISIDVIKTYLTVSDNVDVLTSNDIVITADDYSGATVVGNYNVTFEVSDSSNNVTSKTFEIHLLDDEPPVIKGPSQFYFYVTDTPLTHSQILDFYTFTDNVEVYTGSIQIKNDTYLMTQTPGVYTLDVYVRDSASNESILTVSIHVIDNSGPEFHINTDYIIETNTTTVKSESDIIRYLKASLEKEGIVAENIKIDLNEYEGRSDKKGSYYVYMYYDVDGESYQTRVLIEVVEDDVNYILYGGLTGIGLTVILGSYTIYRKRKQKKA